MNYELLGQKIQSIREEMQMSQEQLAKAIGCSQSALSNYEKGRRRIYLSQLEKLCEVLQKPISYFVEDFEDEKREWAASKAGDVVRMKITHDLNNLSDAEVDEVDRFLRYLKWKRNEEKTL